MTRHELAQHLSQISTMWTVLRQAHAGPGQAATAAQQLLFERYGGAVRRYLLRAVGDPHTADDLLQEFGLALIQGSLRGADPQRGRFRCYVKSVLFHLVSKHSKRRRKRGLTLPADSPELAALPAASADDEREFDDSWRDQLLARTWDALKETHAAFFTVLRFRADHPDLSSTDLAAQLGRHLDKPLSPHAVRQTLHRARERFAELLLDEVGHSLREPTLDRIQEELAALGLLDYCRPALERRQ